VTPCVKHCLGIGAALLSLVAAPARALPPDQIFDRVAPGVWSVKAYAADERLLAGASGVVIAPGKLVTSCRALARARQVQLRRGNAIYDAKLEFPDVERDLCQLDVPGLAVLAPALGTARGLRPGQRLYVVGFSRGNEQSISEGLVSAVSDAATDKERILTTVPASPGLLGAGVFNEEGNLVGVVTASPKDAAATALAVPADWVPEIAARGQAALAARARPAAPGGGPAAGTVIAGLPAAGTAWVYGYAERIFANKQVEVTVRVLRVDDAVVEEAVTAGVQTAKDARRVIDARQSRFIEYPLDSSNTVVELAPYLVAANHDKAPADFPGPVGYPLGSPALPGWVVSIQVEGWEKVTVPAGTFRALRIECTGRRSAPLSSKGGLLAGRFKMNVWFAPEVKRLVRMEHKVWSADSFAPTLINDNLLELTSYRPPS